MILRHYKGHKINFIVKPIKMKKYENTATKTTTMINKLISHQEIINRCLFLSNDGDEKKRKSDFFTQRAQYEEDVEEAR